jgi:hypothetical protein
MSKIITSPVKRWSGSVTLYDPLTIPQAMAFEDALDLARAEENKDFTRAKIAQLLLPGICACVEKWELDGLGIVTPENYPASPKLSSAMLLSWLMGEITTLFKEADEVPNA